MYQKGSAVQKIKLFTIQDHVPGPENLSLSRLVRSVKLRLDFASWKYGNVIDNRANFEFSIKMIFLIKC